MFTVEKKSMSSVTAQLWAGQGLLQYNMQSRTNLQAREDCGTRVTSITN